jgi:hypothetical protein
MPTAVDFKLDPVSGDLYYVAINMFRCAHPLHGRHERLLLAGRARPDRRRSARRRST